MQTEIAIRKMIRDISIMEDKAYNCKIGMLFALKWVLDELPVKELKEIFNKRK